MKWTQLIGSCVTLAVATTAWATPSAQDVQVVQQQLKQAQTTLGEQQKQQQNLAKNMRQTQTQLQKASDELQALSEKERQSAEQLATLQLQLSQLQTQNQHNKAQAQRLLASQYKNKQPEALVLMLKNSNPNDKGRNMVYLRYLHQANEQVLRNLKQQVLEIDAQQQKIAAEHAKLKQLQQQSAQVHQRLQGKRQSQVKAHTVLQQDIAKQQNTIQKLKQDEQQLQSLLARLNRQQAAKAKARSKPKVVAAQTKPKPSVTPQSKQPILAPANVEPSYALTAEDMDLHATHVQTVANDTSPRFAQLQGRMALPSTGTITGRFGTARASGGTWRGIFIHNQGASVYSVSTGEVVYAAPLAGYGSTVIVDHDGGYMTVYSGLASIDVRTGQHLTGRSRLGSSGQLPSGEQGMYFEVRYQTRAMNPLSWVG